MAGWLKLHRSLQEHKLWKNEVFSRGQAWIDLLLLANHTPNEILIGNQTIQIERGSFITSLRGLEVRWLWGRKKVESFFDLLEREQMIGRKSTNKYTYVSIVNYDTYQDNRETKEHTEEHTGYIQGAHTGTSIKKDKKEKEGKKKDKKELVIPNWIIDPACLELLNEWINFRALKKKPVTQKALDLNLKPFGFDLERLKSALEATIAKGWQGIYEDKSFNSNRGVGAIMNPDGSVSGDIDFNRLPAGAKVGIINQNVAKHFEEKERLENLNKNKEIAYDNGKPNGQIVDRVLRAVPQLGSKIRHSR